MSLSDSDDNLEQNQEQRLVPPVACVRRINYQFDHPIALRVTSTWWRIGALRLVLDDRLVGATKTHKS